jgi:hypothetical protein
MLFLERDDVDINTMYLGCTPLYHAVRNGSLSLVTRLLARGARMDILNCTGKDLVQIANKEKSKNTDPISRANFDTIISELNKQRLLDYNNKAKKASETNTSHSLFSISNVLVPNTNAPTPPSLSNTAISQAATACVNRFFNGENVDLKPHKNAIDADDELHEIVQSLGMKY